MGQRPTTSLKILDSMKDSALVSVAELIKKTCLRARQVDAILHSMLKRGLVLHPHRNRWQISSGGIGYLKKWIQKAAAEKEIIQKYISGKTLEEIAKEYPTSSEAVRRLLLSLAPNVIRKRGPRKVDPTAHTTLLTTKQEKEIVEHYKKGLSFDEIEKLFGVSDSTAEKIVRKYAPRLIRPTIRQTRKIAPQSTSLTSAKVFLIGHLIGDGCVMKRSYTISYNNKCLKLVEEVAKVFNKIYGLGEPKITQTKEGVFHCAWFSKEAWKDLTRYTNYKTREWRIPAEIFKNAAELGPPFINALADDDGCVVLYPRRGGGWHRWICLRSINRHGCLDLIRIFSLLGIKARKSNDAVIIAKKKDITLFEQAIGFTEGVKIERGIWKGINKTEVLELLIRSYEDSSIPYQKLSTKRIT